MARDPNLDPGPAPAPGGRAGEAEAATRLTDAGPAGSPTWQVLSQTDAGARWAHAATRRAYGTAADAGEAEGDGAGTAIES